MSLYSATQDLKTSLRASREAILGRGGEISATAGLKDFPLAIANIPNDVSLAFYEDSEIAYRKIVPQKMEAYAMLKKLGGMTYKSKNLANARGWSASTFRNLTDTLVTSNNNGTTISSTEAVNSITVTQTKQDNPSNPFHYSNGYFTYVLKNHLEVGKNYRLSFDLEVINNPLSATQIFIKVNEVTLIKIDITASRMSTVFTYVLLEGFPESSVIEFRNCGMDLKISNIMITEESVTDITYEPYFEGFRLAQPTELLSEGANLADFRGWNATLSNNKESALTTTNSYGTTISTTEAVNSVTVTQSTQGNPDNFSSYLNGYLAYELENHLEVGKRYRLSFDLEVLKNPLSITQIHLLTNGNYGGFADIADRVVWVFEYKKSVLYPERHLMEIRNGGMDCIISNVMITEEAVTDTTYKPLWTASKPIPEAVQALDGYGLGVSAEYNNYIEWRDGRAYFVKKCERIVLDGTEKWYQSNTRNGYARVYTVLSQKPAYTSQNDITPAICNLCVNKTDFETYEEVEGVSFTAESVRFYDSRYNATDTSLWKAYLAQLYAEGNPLTVVYALAEPIETDITHLFTEDNFLKVEGGGSIVAVNEYEYAVPTTIRYTRKVES